MIRFWALLATLSAVACPGRLLTKIPIEHLHDARELPASGRDLAVTGDNAYVIVAGPPTETASARLLRVDGEQVTPILDIPEKRSGICWGERVSGGATWWYGRCNHGVVEFATSASPSLKAVSGTADGIGWMPLEGDEPAGVLVSLADASERVIRAELATPGGAEVLGEFERIGHIAYLPSVWQAHRLEDGAIAIVALEEEDIRGSNRIMLRVFRDGALAAETQLPFARNHWVSVSSALSKRGLAVVAAQPSGGGLTAMVVDVNAPLSAKPHDIKSSDAAILAHYSAVAPVGERFAVTWQNSVDHSVRFAEFDAATALPALIAGEGTQQTVPMLRSEEEGVSLFWSQKRRTLPEQPTGYLLAAELWRWFRVSF
ncbi:MAG TPA: hypothetical protein VM733_10110 [Thermoanaerobaculia bacterium]|nr:hypothetical protein [Thermoanaerobaculia bacterium]